MRIPAAPPGRDLKWRKLRAFLRKARDFLFVVGLVIAIALTLIVTLPVAMIRPYKGDDFDGYF